MTTISDGHKHEIRIAMGMAKCIYCGHTKEEIRHVDAHTEPPRPVSPPLAAPLVAPNSLNHAVHLQSFLSNGNDPLKVSIEIIDNKPVVKFQGMWDGKWLKAAVKGLEREYKMIRHNTTRAAVQQAVKEGRV